ncbi:unnamed protein product [Pneumocystis jirovecii]|uniref:non-specific serine/threonine protein kinase n=1 Tax=Pneumocystis jirovecii TaxID=42068 RepID=L0PGS1_PNEJI|nr:unnamed protein product [Pneumocystis jirovecii]
MQKAQEAKKYMNMLAATLGSKSSLKRLQKREILSVNVPKACEYLSEPPEPLALRLSIFATQGGYYLDQIKNLEVPIRSATERRDIHKTLKMQELNYANSIVGSPDYMAPEILNGHDYDFTVDYWSLGCILFECLTGYPPFSGKNMNETWSNLKNWKYTLIRPIYEEKEFNIQDETWEMITKLITSPRRRLSSIQEVKEQKYFKHIDWTKLRQQEAPFVPDLDSEFDHGYFDDFTNEADMLKYKEVYEKQSSVEAMEDRYEKIRPSVFVGFTYKHQKIVESSGIQEIPNPVNKLHNREVTFETLF